MMCAGICDIRGTLEAFEKYGVDYLHIDIMDGHFVPNFTLGTDYCRELKKLTSIPLDIHLMTEEPEKLLDWFPISGGDIVSVHAESTCHLQKVLAAVREKGARAFAALNPSTPLCTLECVLDDIDGVTVMAVNPGFAGQKMVPSALEKISRLRKYLDESGHPEAEIEVDGNVSFENAALMKKAGANIFVAGTSSVFSKNMTLGEGTEKLRAVIGDE